jgi:hypothetical protein
VHPYEPPRAHNSFLNHGRIPGSPASHGHSPSGDSGTPIYDSLYAEYRRLFRALPGDRTGEEELRFEGFGTVHGTGVGHWDNSPWQTPPWHHHAPEVRRPAALPAARPPGPRDGRSYGY